MPAVFATAYQCVRLLVDRPVITAALVRAEVVFRVDFLLRPAFALLQPSGDWRLRIGRLLFPPVFLTEAAVALDSEENYPSI